MSEWEMCEWDMSAWEMCERRDVIEVVVVRERDHTLIISKFVSSLIHSGSDVMLLPATLSAESLFNFRTTEGISEKFCDPSWKKCQRINNRKNIHQGSSRCHEWATVPEFPQSLLCLSTKEKIRTTNKKRDDYKENESKRTAEERPNIESDWDLRLFCFCYVMLCCVTLCCL